MIDEQSNDGATKTRRTPVPNEHTTNNRQEKLGLFVTRVLVTG